MPDFEPADPNFRDRVAASLDRQTALVEIGAVIETIDPGVVAIAFPFDKRWTQQHGFMHAGIVTTVLDSACGFAAFTLMPADAGVLSVEFKVNLLSPAKGERFVARGEVVRPGRTISVARGEVVAKQDGSEKTIAAMQATIMAVHDRPGIQG